MWLSNIPLCMYHILSVHSSVDWHLGWEASLVAQTVKCLITMRETRVWSLGREDPLEKEMVTHSSTLAWKIPWTEEPVSYSSWGCEELDTTERLHFTSCSSYRKQCCDEHWGTWFSLVQMNLVPGQKTEMKMKRTCGPREGEKGGYIGTLGLTQMHDHVKTASEQGTQHCAPDGQDRGGAGPWGGDTCTHSRATAFYSRNHHTL